MPSMMLAAYLAAALWVAPTPTIEKRAFHAWAPTPPMGWNSWDCFGATVTEEQTKANAGYMAEHLTVHGWQYIVVDIQWYEPQSRGWDYDRNPKPVLDEYGRLWPVVAKFPSSADGRGSVQFLVYSEKALVPVKETAAVAVSLADLGFAGPARIRDLWSHQDLGVFEKDFSRDLAFHGAGLYRVSPVR